ncbi:unnamed protein product [Cuscuta epithymum]|uniref:ATP-dependent DNA helicase n=1 Tax=Cuscuta epithymum TaxID=186058 RepID=A0AAV0E0L3_9ASTE|nr:unnamed protein product [Cuscuta epithymum]
MTEDSMCNIKHGSPLAKLIQLSKLIIWDEAPMTHRHCFEALDRSMRDVLKYSSHYDASLPFAGKTIVFGGDFRQILPVIPKGTRQNIVHAALNSSFLWSFCTVVRLSKNMRLARMAGEPNEPAIQSFADWILKIGDGAFAENQNGESLIEIPDNMIAPMTSDPVDSIVRAIYPDFLTQSDPISYLYSRAILAPTIDEVEKVNDYMLSQIDSELRT